MSSLRRIFVHRPGRAFRSSCGGIAGVWNTSTYSNGAEASSTQMFHRFCSAVQSEVRSMTALPQQLPMSPIDVTSRLPGSVGSRLGADVDGAVPPSVR